MTNQKLNIMTTILGDALKAAMASKEDDLNNLIWKGPKKIINGERMQPVVKLMDATPEQLAEFYKHCDTMLYNESRNNPGRYTLLKIIKDQRQRCNVELYLRYLESEVNGSPIKRFNYLESLKEYLSDVPQDKLKLLKISQVNSGVPTEFEDLPVELVMQGAQGSLGVLEKKHITMSFICRLGIWLDPQELKDLKEQDSYGQDRDRIDVIIERLNLRNVYSDKNPILKDPKFKERHPNPTILKVDPRGLSYKEFRAMATLKSKRYSDLTTEQLTTLRDKLLFRLEDLVTTHIRAWEHREDDILKVAEKRGIELNLSKTPDKTE